MGTEIQLVSTAQAAYGRQGRSSIRLSVEAGCACLSEAKLPVSGIDQLIFTGIYRDRHIGEPSIASLIHGSMAKQLSEPVPNHDFFCFDLSNGCCGFLQAIQLADAFIQQGRIKHGLIVAGDAPASEREKNSFPFTSAASAVLLSETDKKSGFRQFYSKTYPAFRNDLISQLQWAIPPGEKSFRNILKIDTGKDFLKDCLAAARQSLQEFFSLTGTQAGDFDLIIPSVAPAGFGQLLSLEFDLVNKIVLPEPDWGQVHTAGLGFGLRKALNNGTFGKSGNILFLAVGSGLTVAIAWYQKESGV